MKTKFFSLVLFIIMAVSSYISAATLTVSTDTIIADLTIGSGNEVMQTGSNLNISGNFTNNGTFTPNTNTVTLTGTGNVLSGNINFYNLTKQVSTSDVITFGAGKMYNVSGTCTLNGADSNLLTLQSSSSGTQWGFNPSGTRSFSYLDVEDSNNTGNTIMVVGAGCVDSGNNTNWRFTPIFVDVDATSGGNDGTSWADAFVSLQSALDIAVSGDQIWVAGGVYNPTSAYGLTDTPRFYHFEMIEEVEIYGGFSGTEDYASFNLSDRDFLTNETILSGDIDGTVGLSAGDCYNVIHNPSTVTLSNAAILDGFTITGGNANEISGYDHKREGGGIYNDWNAAPIIRNCIIKSNYADANGGGIYFSMPSNLPTLINCLICDNHTGAGDHYNGGGIASNQGSQVALYNCTISGNSAYDGGGIFHAMTTFNMYNCIVWGNSASNEGNDIFVEAGANTNLNNCCYDTSGIYINSGTVTPNEYCTNEFPAFSDEDTNDYRLCGNSSCLDVGNNSYCSQTKDIRGLSFDRKLSKTDHTQAGTIDMGAYEYCEGTDPITSFKTYYVDINVDGGNNNGTDWSNAFTSLQSALDVVSWGDQIWVAGGTYLPSKDVTGNASPTDPKTKCFIMIEGVKIYGGFAGSETEISQRTDFGVGSTNETILSGDFDDNDTVTGAGETLTFANISDNAYHVFNLPSSLGLTTTAVLDGFTIKGGISQYPNFYGGGIYNTDNSPTLSNLNIIQNYATGNGAGIYNDGGSLVISNSNISWNGTPTSESMGAGIYNYNGVINITYSYFLYNKGGTGGAIGNQEAISNLTNCIVAGNFVGGYGGAVYNHTDCVSNFYNVTFTENTAEYQGGAISTWYGGSCVFDNCIIFGNSAPSGAQFYLSNGSSSTVGEVTLNYSCYGNNTGDIYNNGCTFMATNNNINDDPLFVDVDNGDYRIFGISPCADVGNDIYNSEDYDYRGTGYPRKLLKTDYTQVGTIDIGAHEYKSDVDPWCPPYFMAKSSGNWSSTSIWYTNYTGGTDPVNYTTAAAVIPTADNSSGIVINSNVFIVGDVDIDVIADQLTVNSGHTLTVDGSLTVADGDGTDLTVEGTLDINGTLSVGTATVDINGTIDATGGNVTFTDAGNLLLSGTIISLGTFTSGNSTVTYDGDDQIVLAENYNILVLSSGSTDAGVVKTFADGITKIEQEINLDESMTLTGSSADNVTVQVTTPYDWDGTYSYNNADATNSRVFNIEAYSGTITIQNMTIKGGDLSENGEVTAGFGGAIYLAAGTVTLDGVVVTGSRAYYGGGIYCTTSAAILTLDDCTVSYNTTNTGMDYSNTYGGGLYCNSYADVTLNNTTITRNNCGYGYGGSSNSGFGGGIYLNENAEISLTDCTISYNRTANSTGISGSSLGGGFYTETNSTMTLINCTIANNNTTSGGMDSSGSYNGGGIYNRGSTTITNSTISENTAASNIMPSYGGGVYNYGTLNIRNTVIANNNSDDFMDGGKDYYYYSGTLTDNGYNVIENQGGSSTGASKTFNSSTDILYNTKADGTSGYSSWNQNNINLDNQALNLSDTLADNETTNSTQTLALNSPSFAIAAIPYGSSPYWNNSPETGGSYFDQRGVEHVANSDICIGAYSEPQVYYRSIADGNWSSYSIWEISYDNVNWSAATVDTETPTADNSAEITINSNVTIAGGADVDITADQMTVNSDKVLTVESGAALTIADGNGTDLTLNGILTIYGTITYNGTATINDNSTVNYAENSTTTVIENLSYYDLTIDVVTSTGDAIKSSKKVRKESNIDFGTAKTLAGNITVRNNLTIDGILRTENYDIDMTGTSGTLDVNGTLDIVGTVDANGTFDATGGTVEFQFGGAGALELGSTVISLGSSFYGGDGNVTYDGADQDIVAGSNILYGSITLSGSGTKTISDQLNANALLTSANDINVVMNGDGTTIASVANFLNTGTLTIGDDPSDEFTFQGGIVTKGNTSNPSSTTIQGTITTASTEFARIKLGDLIVAGNTTLDPVGNELRLGSTYITISDGSTLTVGTGNTGNAYIDGAVDSESGGKGNLTINSNSAVPLAADFGQTDPLGTITLTSGIVQVGARNISADNLQINGGSFGLSSSPSGNWDVEDVTIASGATLNATSGSFNVSGNWTNNGTFDHKNGTVIFDGSSESTLTGATDFYDLTINNSGGVTLAGNTSVENDLTLTDGLIALGDYDLTLAGIIAGTPSASNMVVTNGTGILKREFLGTGSIIFPIGDNTSTAEYSPATIDFTAGTFSSAWVGVKVTQDKHSEIPGTTNYINRYWTVTQSGVTDFICNTNFQYLTSDVEGTESIIMSAQYDGSDWTDHGFVDDTNHQINCDDISSFSDFAGRTFAPATQAHHVSNSSTTYNSTTLGWTRGDGDYCAVFMQEDMGSDNVESNSEINPKHLDPIDPVAGASPIDMTTYTADTVFGDGSQIEASGWYCIYNGDGISVDVTGLSKNTTYNVHVCEYNGEAGSELYLTDGAINNPNSFTTPNPYYMAKADGDWSSTTTWYLSGTDSTDPMDYSTSASEYPTASNSDGIIINADIAVDTDISVDQLLINAEKTLSNNSNVSLTIANGEFNSNVGTNDIVITGSLVNDGTLIFADETTAYYNGTTGTVTPADYYYLTFYNESGDNTENLKSGEDQQTDVGNYYTFTGDVTTRGDVTISSNVTVDIGTHSFIVSNGGSTALYMQGAITASTGTFGIDQMNSSSGSITFTDAGNMYFYAGTNGTYTFNCGTSTTHYMSEYNQDIYPATYYNLIIGSSLGDKIVKSKNSLVDGAGEGIKILTGAINIDGDLTILAGHTLDVSTSNYQIKLAGDWTDNGAFEEQQGTVVFDGADQTIGAETFHDATTSGTGTQTMSGNVSITNNFTTAESTNWICDQYTLSLGGVWTHSGSLSAGTGTVVYNAAGDQTFVSEDYNNVQLSTGGIKTLGGDVDLMGNLVIDSGVTFDVSSSNWQINLAGNWENSGTFTAENGTVVFDGTTTQEITSGGSAFYNADVNSSLDLQDELEVNNLFDLNESATLTSSYNVTLSCVTSGTGTVNIAEGTFTYNYGGDQIVYAGTYYSAGFAGSGTKTILGIVDIDDDVTIGTGVTLETGSNSYQMNVAGNWTNNGTFAAQEGTVIFDGTTDQTISASAFHNATFSAGNVDNTLSKEKEEQESSTDISYNKILSGNLDLSGNLLIETGCILDVSTNNYQINLAGNWTDNGAFEEQQGTVVFDGADQSMGAETFYNATTSGTGTKTMLLDWTISNILTTGLGTTLYCDDNNLILQGTWTDNGTFAAGTGTVIYSGTNQPVNGVAYYNVEFSGTDTKTLADAIDISNDLTINSSVTLSSSANNYAITLDGDWINNGSYNANSNNVIFAGSDAQSILGTNSFYDLTINNSGAANIDASASTLAVTNLLNITDGQFKSASDYEDVTIGIDGTLELSGDITVSGNWSNDGTFNAGTYLVTLDGNDQSISGNSTFYDLKKNITSTAALTFENGSTQTISNSLDLQGAADNLLSLRSDSDGTQWIIDVPATEAADCTIAYIDIKDSNNIGEEVKAHHTNSVDSGNNVNWEFRYEPYLTTQDVSDIVHYSATGNGTITDIGFPTATQHGVCWSTETNPTIDDVNDFKTEEGIPAETGAFTSNITNLEEGTLYYVRAYAVDSYGTGYGNEVSFTTNYMPDFVYDTTNYENGDSVYVDTDEDTALTFELQVTDGDTDQTFNWIYSENTHGTVSINSISSDHIFGKNPTDPIGSFETKQIVFTPTAQFNGEAEFTVEVGDGVATDKSTLKFKVTVNPINDIPVCTVTPAITGNLYVNEELSVSDGIWNDDLDVDNTTTSYAFDPVYTYQWQEQALDESAGYDDILDATSSTYTVPDNYYNKTLRCLVTCTDDGEGTPAAQDSVAISNEVTILNTAPVFIYDGNTYESGESVDVSTNEDVNLVFNLTVDDDNANQTFTWDYQNETHGSVSIANPLTDNKSTQTKQITYDPDLDYYGEATFDITVFDNITDATSTLTFNVTMNAINDIPVNTVTPEVSGDLHVNETLSCTLGTWNDDKDINETSYSWSPTYTYQWQKSSDDITYTDVTDSTRSEFITPDNYSGLYVRCQVTATDAGFGTPAAQDSTIASNSVQIINTAPEFVFDGTTYVSGSTIDLDAAKDTDLIFNLMVHDDNAGQTISWNSVYEEHGSVSIDDVPADDPTEVTKQITFTPELDYMGAAGFTISVTDNITDVTSTLEFDLIIKPYTVYVDDDWIGYSYGNTVQDTLVYGKDAFENINDAVDGVAPTGTIHVLAGTHGYGVHVDKSVTLTTAADAVFTYSADKIDAALYLNEDNITVTGFIFQNVTDAIIGVGQNIVIINNEFINCTNGVTNMGTDVIDAKRNWWDDLHGPKHPDNPNYDLTNGAAVSDYVDFYPWKATETVTEETEYVKVYEDETDALVVIAVSDVIQTGIDAAVDGNIVEVTDGTYTEDLIIDKRIILRSENGSDLTTIQQIVGIGISIRENSSNFTLGGTDVGFTILCGNNTSQMIRIDGAPSDVSIIDNNLEIEGYAFEGISINSDGTSNLTISNNDFQCDNGDSGIWLPNSSNASVINNTFTCSGFPISGWAMHISGNTDPMVSENTITNFNIGINLSCGSGYSGGEVTENTINDCSHSIYVSQWSPSATFGIMQNIELSENTIYSDQVAVFIGDGTYIDASTFVVKYNNFLPAAVDDGMKVLSKFKERSHNNRLSTESTEYLHGFTLVPVDLTNYGVYNAHSTEIVTAEDNWWNDIDGPYHDPNNLDTNGQNVSDNVDFRPWAVGIPAIDNLDHIFDLVITSPGSVDNITSVTPIPFNVNFGEAVEGFDESTEISVTGDYVDDPVVITDEGTGLFTLDLQPEFDAAAMTVSVAAEAAEDVAGNYNEAVDLTITYDALVAKFIITVTPNPILLWDPFDISVEAVDIYDIRDTDYDQYVALSTNHSDFVNLSGYIYLTDGIGEITTAGMSTQLTDDLDITAAELITYNYLSTLEDVPVILPGIDPPHGFDGIGDPVANDVPDDQGGWITLEYGLSQNDPFHPNPVLPYIDSYLVERNNEPDGSGAWETFCTINCYSPNAAGNVTALLNVPEDNTPYPYRMSALYIPGIDEMIGKKTVEDKLSGKLEITYLNNAPLDDTNFPSKQVYIGRVAGADNIPAFADIKVFLEGAYDSNNRMIAEHTIPTISPYSGTNIDRLPEINGNTIIDWIELQLRRTVTGETEQSIDAFLLDNGTIVSTDGGMCFPFFFTSNIDYFLVIHHRNHLDVMTAADYVLGDSENSTTQIYLTDRNDVFGNDMKLVDDETFAMYSGDADDNGIVNLEDMESFNTIDEKGYFAFDFDMNGFVTQSDLENYFYPNIDIYSCIPNAGENLRGGDDNYEPAQSEPQNDVPQFVELHNYPNPFNPTTNIEFSLKANEAAQLEIFNLKGQKVRTFNIEPKGTQQVHSVVWNGMDENGRKVTSGIYLYKLSGGARYTCTKKMILLK